MGEKKKSSNSIVLYKGFTILLFVITLLSWLLFINCLVRNSEEFYWWGGIVGFVYTFIFQVFKVNIVLTVITYVLWYRWRILISKSDKLRKKRMHIITVSIVLIIGIYVLTSVVQGIYFKDTLEKIISTEEGYTQEIQKVIPSESVFDSINMIENHGKKGETTYHLKVSNPIFVHYFFGGEIIYTYSDWLVDNDTGKVVYGSFDIPIVLKYHISGGKIIIDSKSKEHP